MKNWKYRKMEPERQAYSSLLYRLSYPDHVSNLHFTSLIHFPHPLSEYMRFSEVSPIRGDSFHNPQTFYFHKLRTWSTWFGLQSIPLYLDVSKSNISIIQRSQSKILRMIANAPWYVPNITLHEDLNVPLVKEVIERRSTRNHNKLEGHVNVLIQPLLEPHNERIQKELTRRPKWGLIFG
jgi:hypothetical protein